MKFQVHSPCGTQDIQQQRRRGVGGEGGGKGVNLPLPSLNRVNA